MKRKEEEHQEIIDGLQNMPKIKDDTDKNMLYNRISLTMSNTRVFENRHKKKKLVPIIATILTAIIIVLVPFMIQSKDQINQNAKQFSESELETNSDTANTRESIVMENSDGDAATNYSTELDEIKMNKEGSFNSFIIQESSKPYKIIFGAIPDLGQQYIIPVSFIVDQDANVEEYYNELENYMKSEEWATNDYMLANASFQLKESEVLIDLGDNFSIGAGSTNAYIFEQMLATMFTPYGINKAVFQSGNNGGVELGPFGITEELSLRKEDDFLYKLYNNQFLIPIPNSNLSIHDAISEMKLEQEEFNIGQTIPEEVHFTVESSDDQLLLTLAEDSPIENGQEEITMTEAILMTAKSYGYQSVQFNNFPINQIGAYDITKPIQVPEAVNPVDIRN